MERWNTVLCCVPLSDRAACLSVGDAWVGMVCDALMYSWTQTDDKRGRWPARPSLPNYFVAWVREGSSHLGRLEMNEEMHYVRPPKLLGC